MFDVSEKRYIRHWYGKVTTELLAEAMGLSALDVAEFAIKAGLRPIRRMRSRKRWTKQDDDFLRKNCARMTAPLVADMLRREVRMVKLRAKKLGLQFPRRRRRKIPPIFREF